MFATKSGTRGNFQVYTASQLSGSYVDREPGDCVAIGMPAPFLAAAKTPAAKRKKARTTGAPTFAPPEPGKVGLASAFPPNNAHEFVGIVVQASSNQIVVARPPELVPIRLLGDLGEFQAWGPRRNLYLSWETEGRVTGFEPEPGTIYRLIAKLPLLFNMLTNAHFTQDGPEEMWVSILDGEAVFV